MYIAASVSSDIELPPPFLSPLLDPKSAGMNLFILLAYKWDVLSLHRAEIVPTVVLLVFKLVSIMP
ncbi:hypothetical protein D3C86_1911580 [compost metagenome]